MPSGHICGRRNASRKLIWRVQLLILNESAQSLRALLIVIQLEKAQLGRTDGGTDELVDFALVFGVEKELSVIPGMLMELFFELDDMLEYELFFGGVFLVGRRGVLLFFELSASFHFLVDYVFSSLKELSQLLVCFGLHE